MEVLSVTSELFPLIKTGGLADVAGALPPALAGEGIAVTTLVPGYPAVMEALPERTVFHRYGDHYFLVQVWPAGATTGRAIPKSRQELEIERHGLARTVRDGSNSVEIVSVAVASN